MPIYMMANVTPFISPLPDYNRIAEVRVGSNGDSTGIPGYDVGASSSDLTTGQNIWDTNSGSGFSTGPVSVALIAQLGSGDDTFGVYGAPSELTYNGEGGATIESVQIRADAQITGTVQWSGVNVAFYKDGAFQESVSLDQGPQVDTTDSSSSGTAEQIVTVRPSSSDDDEVVVTGTYSMSSPSGTNPGPNDLFGQIVISSNTDSGEMLNDNSLDVSGPICMAVDADHEKVDIWQDASAAGERRRPDEVQRYRLEQRHRGMKQLRIWAPDPNRPEFAEEAQRQGRLLRGRPEEAEALDFIAAAVDWPAM